MGEVIGLLSGGVTGVSLLAKLASYRWYELAFMLFFVGVLTVLGGFAGQIIQKEIQKKWNGKKL